VLADPSVEDLAKLAAFAERHAVQIYLQTGGIASVRPLREGYAALNYAIESGPVRVEFGPMDFVQVNRAINTAMVQMAMDQLAPSASDRVLDLFCGVGNFTLPLARRGAAVTGVEGDPALVERARANALHNSLANAEFVMANLFEPAGFGTWAERRYDLVLIDPPRAGASQVLGHMSHWCPRRLVYISCHAGSLARDAGILVETQGFKLTAAGVMDMFPQTTHVESIAVFDSRT
jgi:23S rRNA (uracil1939-C5)-methyltransferase